MPLPTENTKRLFFQSSILVVIVFLCPLFVAAQTAACKLSLTSLPAASELKGFHLGMTMEQAKAHVPQIVFGPTDPLGSSKTTINPGFDPRGDKSKFQDVRSISLDFLDGRLVSLWIGYETNFKWTGVPEFVAGISQSLSLPNAWTEWKLRGRQMRCTDFELTVSMIAQAPSFRIVDSSAEEVLVARRNAAAEEEAETEEVEIEEFVGDTKSKMYYLPTCQPVVEVIDENRVVFKSAVEAEKAGYKRAKGC